MTDEDIENLLDGQDPSAVADMLEGAADRLDSDESAAVLIRLAEVFRAYAARIKPSRES
jgi:hypothetical protein